MYSDEDGSPSTPEAAGAPDERHDRTADAPPTFPRGGRTLMEILDDAAARGFTAHAVGRDGRVECGNCSTVSDPATLTIRRVDRLEGASDAADEMLVVWFECPHCGVGNTLTLGYGSNSSTSDVGILDAIELPAP